MQQIEATPELPELLRRYDTAKAARARWAVEEAELKEAILRATGYDSEELTDPQSADVVAPDGTVTFSVKVGTWRGLNQKRLKEERPDVYAMYETSRPTIKLAYDAAP